MAEVSKSEDILIVINSQLKKLNLQINLTKKPTKVGGELFWESEVYSISDKPNTPRPIGALFGFQLPIKPLHIPNDKDAAQLTAEFQKRLGDQIGKEAQAYFFEKEDSAEGRGYVLKVREDLIHHVNLKKNEAHVRSVLSQFQEDLNLSNAPGEPAKLESSPITVDDFVDRLTAAKDETKQIYLIGGAAGPKLDPQALHSKDIDLFEQERGCDDLLKDFLRGKEMTVNHRAYAVVIDEGDDGVRKIRILVALTDITPPAPKETDTAKEDWGIYSLYNWKVRGIMPPPRPTPEQTTAPLQPRAPAPAPTPIAGVEIQRGRAEPQRQTVAPIRTVPKSTDRTNKPKKKRATAKPKASTTKSMSPAMNLAAAKKAKPTTTNPAVAAAKKFRPSEERHKKRNKIMREQTETEAASLIVPKEHPQKGDKGKGKK